MGTKRTIDSGRVDSRGHKIKVSENSLAAGGNVDNKKSQLESGAGSFIDAPEELSIEETRQILPQAEWQDMYEDIALQYTNGYATFESDQYEIDHADDPDADDFEAVLEREHQEKTENARKNYDYFIEEISEDPEKYVFEDVDGQRHIDYVMAKEYLYEHVF